MTLMPIIPGSQATAYRLDNVTADGVTLDASASNALDQLGALAWRPNATRLFFADTGASSTGDFYYFDLSTAGDISTASYVASISTGGSLEWLCIAFNGDGTKLFGQTLSNIYTHTLSTAYGGTISATATDTFGRSASGGFFFNEDGTAVYYRNSGGSGFYTRTLSTAYDISTKGSETAISTPFPSGDMSVARSGTRVLITESGQVSEYEGDAYDFASFALKETFTTSSPVVSAYTPNGRKLHVATFRTTLTQYSTAG